MKVDIHNSRVCGPSRLGRVILLSTMVASLIVCAGAQIVDRIVAKVNGRAVLQSDWDQEISFEAFSDARDPNTFTRNDRSLALTRLIDQELLREQLRPAQTTPREQIAARIAAIRQLHGHTETEDGWKAELQRFDLTQAFLEKRVGEQLLLMKLVDDRLRPSIQIDQDAVEAYYKDHLVPEMSQAGSATTPLPEVSEKIRDLLAEKKMNELLSGWLASLRSTSQIDSFEDGSGERSR